VKNSPFQDQVVGEEVVKEVSGDPMKWKGVMRKLFSDHVGRRRGGENRKFRIAK
jgi:hypothetical protein